MKDRVDREKDSFLLLVDTDLAGYSQEFTLALKAILRGDYEDLALEILGQEIFGFLNHDTAATKKLQQGVFASLYEAVRAAKVSHRIKAIALTHQMAGHSLKRNQKEQILQCNAIFCRWLKDEKEVLPGVESVAKIQVSLISWLLVNGNFHEAMASIRLLKKISSGELQKTRVQRGIAGRSLSDLSGKKELGLFCKDHFNPEKWQFVEELFAILPAKSAHHLVALLRGELLQHERRQITRLLIDLGEDTVDSIAEYCRNNLEPGDFLLALEIAKEVGGDRSLALANRLLSSKNESVQLASIDIIVDHGGKAALNLLLDAFSVVSDSVKIHLLKYLLGEDIFISRLENCIISLASSRHHLEKDIADELMLTVIFGLKKFASADSLALLGEIEKEQRGGGWSSMVGQAVVDAIRTVEPKVRSKKQKQASDLDTISFSKDPVELQKATKKLVTIEKEIRDFDAGMKTEKASQYLYQQGIDAVEKSEYILAEKLRDRMLEINPSAFIEAIRLAELIDKGKADAISKRHLGLWHDLLTCLTKEVYTAVYHSFCKEKYLAGDVVVKSGEINNCLYFLNSGTLGMHCITAWKDLFLKKCVPGEILGGEHFFKASVWTISLVAMTEVEVHILERSKFKQLGLRFPQLEGLLADYCRRFEKASDLVKMSGDERRKDIRYPLSMPSRHILLDKYGQRSTTNYRGTLLDISNSGVAFSLKLSNREKAEQLLGRQIITRLAFPGKQKELAGIVVGVRAQDLIDSIYSVHVKLAGDCRAVVQQLVGKKKAACENQRKTSGTPPRSH